MHKKNQAVFATKKYLPNFRDEKCSPQKNLNKEKLAGDALCAFVRTVKGAWWWNILVNKSIGVEYSIEYELKMATQHGLDGSSRN